MDQPYFNDLSSIRSNAKEMSRLYKAICEALSASPQRTELLLDCARAVARGLFQIGDGIPNALDWHTVFAEFSKCDLAALDQPHELPPGTKQHDLAAILAQQPTAVFPAREQEACEQVAALALMQLMFRPNRPLPALFFRGLRNMYCSGQPAWKGIRKEIADGAPFSSDFVSAQPKGVRQTFVVTVHDLLNRGIPEVIHAFPAISHGAVQVEQPKQVLAECVNACTPAIQKLVDLSPNLALLELVRRDDDFAPPIDSYRVGFQWDALHPNELKLVLNRIGTVLNCSDEESLPLRLAACFAVVALFARTSFERALRLPIVRRGTLHLDLRCGLLRRHLSVLADRTDAENGPRTRGYWLRTFLPKSVCEMLLEAHSLFPQEESLGQLLGRFGVTEQDCIALINKHCEFVHKPESLRFARSLSQTMLSLSLHPAIVSLATGDTTIVPSAEPYYLCRSQKEIHDAVSTFCQWADLPPPRPLNKDRLIGSPHSPTKQEIQSAFLTLSQVVLKERMQVTSRSSLEVRNNFFNFYVVAVVLQFLWSVGGRFACLETLTFNRVLGFEDAALIHDKQTDAYSAERCVPLSDEIKKTLRHYLEHLRAHASYLAAHGYEKCAQHLKGISEGNRQTLGAFELIVDGPNGILNTRTVELKDIHSLAQKVWPGELNRPRHFYVNELVSRRVSQVVIDGFSGRYCRGAEPFGFSSGIAVCDYIAALRPVLNEIHDEIGLKAISGFGQTAARYLVYPKAPVRPGLKPHKNQFLEQRLQEAELIAADIARPAEECPFSADTLLSLSKIRFLRDAYMRSAAPAKYPRGALVFTLAAFDCVVAPHEVEKFYDGIVGGLVRNVGGLAMIELQDRGRVVSQRVLSNQSIVAAAKVGNCSTNCSFSDARRELAQLLTELDETWCAKQNANALNLVTALASHAMTYEVPMHLQVAIHHKAPIIPVEDLARIFLERPCKNGNQIEGEISVSTIASKSYKLIMQKLRAWADRENRVGEQQARKAGLRKDLQQLIDSNSLLGEEKLLAEWLISELAERPLGRRLKIQVLEKYTTFALSVFERIGIEQTFHLDMEVWREILDELERGQSRRKARARWVLTHVCNFLSYKGAAVPRGLLSRQPSERRAPRNPIYVTHEECRQICELASDHQSPFQSSETGGLRFRLARNIPLRPVEVRYAKLSHLSPDAGLLAVTTGGHGHLKAESARGLLPIPVSLLADMQELYVRRCSLGPIADVPIFAGISKHGPNLFDSDTATLVSATRHVTGQGTFRSYDLRACAITDLIASPGELLHQLAQPIAEVRSLDLKSINVAHQRVALAQRLARHRSPFTTLLSYNAAGNLELAVYQRRATVGFEPSSTHISAMCGLKPNAIDKRVSFRSKNELRIVRRAEILSEIAQGYVEVAQKPALASCRSGELIDLANNNLASDEKIIRAGLAVFLGNNPEAISDVLRVPSMTLNATLATVNRRKKTLQLGCRASPKHRHLLFENETLISKLVEALPAWFATNRASRSLNQQGLLCTVDKAESSLVIPDEEILRAWLPHLKALMEVGVQVYFQPRTLHLSTATQDSLSAANVLVCKRAATCRGYGVIRFGLASKQRYKKGSQRQLVPLPSPHLSGRVGRLIVECFLLAEATQQINQDEGK